MLHEILFALLGHTGSIIIEISPFDLVNLGLASVPTLGDKDEHSMGANRG